jgi:tripeptide aminopeptidase
MPEVLPMMDWPIDRERLLGTFTDLVQMNAPSRREGDIARRLQQVLTDLGAEVHFDAAAAALDGESGNLFARLPGTMEGPALLFCAHMDTVEPTAGLTVQHVDGVFSSDGSTILGADDRAGVAAVLEVLQVLRETDIPYPPLEIVFTVAEEVGLMGSTVMDYDRLTASVGFVPDGSGPVGLVITRAPAQQHLSVNVHGRAAHAGMAPEEGINAIAVAAKAISRMRLGRIDEETTANIGSVEGGKATNIVPDLVVIEGEARSRDPQKLAAQAAHMRTCFEEAAAEAGARAEVEISDVYPSFTLADDHRAVQLAKLALTEVGVTPRVTATGGGSDANFLNAHGIATVILSAGYEHPHGHDECLPDDQLVLLAQCLYQIVRLAGAGAI